MHNTLSSSSLTIITLLSFMACGEVVPVNTDGGAGSDDASLFDAAPGDICQADIIPFDDLLPCIVQAQCEYFVRCEAAEFTVEECVALFAENAASVFTRTEEAIGEGRVTYDGTAAAACSQGFATASCNDNNDGGGGDCQALFVGSIADGASCFIDEECIGVDANCDGGSSPDQCSMGVCVDRAGLDEDCSIRSCFRGDHCVETNVSVEQCKSGALNADCNSDWHCDSGLYCPAGTCQEGLAINIACTENSQCADPMRCIADTCAFTDTLGVPCENSCDNNLICERSAPSPALGICVEKYEAGATCERNSQCVSGLLCRDSDSTCQPRPVLNEPCMRFDCVQGLYCTNELPGTPQPAPAGTCVEPSANGQPCDRDRHCTSRICSSANVCEEYMSCY